MMIDILTSGTPEDISEVIDPSFHDGHSPEPSTQTRDHLEECVVEESCSLAPAFLSRQTSATLWKRRGLESASSISLDYDTDCISEQENNWRSDQLYPLSLMFTGSDIHTSLPDYLHRTTQPKSLDSSVTDLTSSQSCRNIPHALRERSSQNILKTASETCLNDEQGGKPFLTNRSYTYSDISSCTSDGSLSGCAQNEIGQHSPSRKPKGGTYPRRRDDDTKKVRKLSKMFEEQAAAKGTFHNHVRTSIKPMPLDPGQRPGPKLVRNLHLKIDLEDNEEEKRRSLDSSLNELNIAVDQDAKRNRSGFSSRFGKKLARKFIPHSIDTGSLLQYAITTQDVELVEKLLQSGDISLEVNMLHPPGVSVLHQACALGNFAIVKLLIEKGADVRMKTWNELTPTKIAAMFGHFDVTKLLLLTGADVDDVVNGVQC